MSVVTAKKRFLLKHRSHVVSTSNVSTQNVSVLSRQMDFSSTIGRTFVRPGTHFSQIVSEKFEIMMIVGAAIAQWNHLRLLSCCPGFKVPNTPFMLFSIYIVQIVYLSHELECEKNKIKQKEAGIGQFFLKNCNVLMWSG